MCQKSDGRRTACSLITRCVVAVCFDADPNIYSILVLYVINMFKIRFYCFIDAVLDSFIIGLYLGM